MKSKHKSSIKKRAVVLILAIIIIPNVFLYCFIDKQLVVKSNSIENINSADFKYLSEEFDFNLSEKIKPYQIFTYYGSCYVVLEINEREENIKETIFNLRNLPDYTKEEFLLSFDPNERPVSIVIFDKNRTDAALIDGIGLTRAYYYTINGRKFVQIQKGGANVDRARFDLILKGGL